MRPGFFLKESFRSIKRNALPSFAALASVLVTTLVLGVFIPVVEADERRGERRARPCPRGRRHDDQRDAS